jgi:hypothetical protein
LVKLPLKAIDSVADRVFSVLGALTLAQAPAFIAHYLQRLAGHLAEAERNVAGWTAIASKAGLGDVVELAARYRSSTDTDVIAAGNKCLADMQRVEQLRDALSAIRDAPAWRRGIEFLFNMDRNIAAGTFGDFTPNLPVSMESAAYALLGIIAGLLAYRMTKATFRLLAVAIAATASGSRGNGRPGGREDD